MDEPLSRILYVEDCDEVAEVTLLMLEELGGFRVARFASAEAALEGADACDPQLLLLDMMLPGMSGVELLTCLRRRPGHAHRAAVMLTARVQTHEVEAYRRAGALDVIVKPYDAMELCPRLERIWRAHLAS